MATKISVLEQSPVQGEVFRVAELVNGVCERSISVRFDLTGDGWAASFYGCNRLDDAHRGTNPMKAIPAELADLAIDALGLLVERQNAWLEET